MTRKEAMEWADRYFDFATKAQTRGEVVSKLADLFQEATKGMARMGDKVEWRWGTSDINTDPWRSGWVTVMGRPDIKTCLIRPIREKRRATREELIFNIRAITGFDNGVQMYKTETLQAMARDLGIRTEVEVDE